MNTIRPISRIAILQALALALAITLAPVLGAADAAAKVPLKEQTQIFDQLLEVAVAHAIRENCDTISARMIKAQLRVLHIYNDARHLGYSYAEVKAYTADKTEQKRLRTAAYAFLDAHGVDREDPASYCPLGLAEIRNKSPIGKLLKAN